MNKLLFFVIFVSFVLILHSKETVLIKSKYSKSVELDSIYKFYNKNVESFIDTLNGKQNILNIENDFDDITKYLDIDSFFELNDSVAIKYPGFFHWSILVRTNKRDKNIYVYVNPTSTNILVEDLVYLLVNFNNYHQRRIANLLGGWE